jgi:hypothetical protein
MNLYTASWSDDQGSGGAWVPASWNAARAILIGQLERNLDRWPSRCVPGERERYEAVLAELRTAVEPPPGRSWVRSVGRHRLALTRDVVP